VASHTKSRLLTLSNAMPSASFMPLCVRPVAFVVKLDWPSTLVALSPFAIVEVAASNTITRLFPVVVRSDS
jgi:hypothetical protein